VCLSHTAHGIIYFTLRKIVDLFFFFIFKALIVSAGSSGYTDLVFGVQWSWTEAEERAEQLQGLSDCVSRRLDQGTIYHKNPEWKPEREKELCNIWILPWGGGGGGNHSRILTLVLSFSFLLLLILFLGKME
jgi:hypothetical protein